MGHFHRRNPNHQLVTIDNILEEPIIVTNILITSPDVLIHHFFSLGIKQWDLFHIFPIYLLIIGISQPRIVGTTPCRRFRGLHGLHGQEMLDGSATGRHQVLVFCLTKNRDFMVMNLSHFFCSKSRLVKFCNNSQSMLGMTDLWLFSSHYVSHEWLILNYS